MSYDNSIKTDFKKEKAGISQKSTEIFTKNIYKKKNVWVQDFHFLLSRVKDS